MEASSVSVCEAVSSVLSTLEEERKLAYSHSGIQLVSEMNNKYPLSDVIMRSYTGHKFNGVLEGHGSVEFKDGHTYEGNFHKGVMHGQGQYSWKDGLVYEGEFCDCKITGVGKYTWPDGSTYTGEVHNGLRHGHGTYWCAVTGSTYVGRWVEGRREGKGKLIYKSYDGEESYYDGDWVDNQQEGVGTRRFRSGNVYEGEWHLNERHGNGTMHWYDRGERYTGQWIRGIQHGRGEHMWIIESSNNAQYPLCNRYDGEWHQGKRQGFGTFHYANGSKYIGEWQEDLKHGRGKFVFQSGQVFEGDFQKDKMMGGTTSEVGGAGLLRPKTPLGSLIGDIDHSDIVGGGSVTEKFNLEICKLLPESNVHHELQQVHRVLMRHITQLKKIYHFYSSLGSGDSGGYSRCCTLTQMQLWRLLMDCHLHHQSTTLHDIDYIIHMNAPPSNVHNPNHTFLMREFLQLLVYLSHHLITDPQDNRPGSLSRKLSSFITTHLLPNACHVGGTLYCRPLAQVVQALTYQQGTWQLYQRIQSINTGIVRLRDILLLLKEHGVVTDWYPAIKVVREMVNDNPLAVDGEDYNLEVKVTFLEFFEILLQCAQEWFEEKRTNVEQNTSLPVVTVTSEVEESHQQVDSSKNDTTPAHVKSTESLVGVECAQEAVEQSAADVEEDAVCVEESVVDGGSSPAPGDGQEVVTYREDSGKLDSCVVEEVPTAVEYEQDGHWHDMLQAFFIEHLLSKPQNM